MSDLNEGTPCPECTESGRCHPSCGTRGGGQWLSMDKVTVSVGVSPCFLPNGERGVRVTSAHNDRNGGRSISRTDLANPAAQALMNLILAAMEKP